MMRMKFARNLNKESMKFKFLGYQQISLKLVQDTHTKHNKSTRYLHFQIAEKVFLQF